MLKPASESGGAGSCLSPEHTQEAEASGWEFQDSLVYRHSRTVKDTKRPDLNTRPPKKL